MPEYREPVTKYHCRQCGQEYERRFETSDENMAPCPFCHSLNVERLYFHPLVKVEGWDLLTNITADTAAKISNGDTRLPVRV